MQKCPACDALYPEGHTHCDRDGQLLGAELAGGSVDISMSVDTNPTAAESPSGRGRLRGSTVRNSGTRVSVGPPPTLPSDVSSKPVRKRDEARVRAEARVGEVLGSYRLQGVLGCGGMGAVYTALHVKLGRRVALKLLHGQYADRHEAVVRFFQEAQAVNRIRHKNIVDVTDLVELPDGTAFIIMELLEGESLGQRLRTQGLLGTAATLSVLIQICDALDAAHREDIVHRDLKPDNIFLTETPDGELLVKLLDFGVAKLVGKHSEIGVKTAAGAVVGTPAFMSPEQAGGLQIDLRSDIYSLGAIMYQLFTGQHVFRGKSFGEYVKMHLNSEPLPPRQSPGGVNMDPELEAIIMRCLQKSPDARYPSASALRADLMTYADLHAELVTGPPTPMAPVPIGELPQTIQSQSFTPPPQAPALRQLTEPPRAKRPILIAAIAAATVIAIVSISLAISGSGESKPAAAPAPDAAPQVIIATPMPIDAQTKPSAVKVRIEANVLAQVYQAGGEDPLCGTPCELGLDPAEGMSRSFVLRAPGYEDSSLEVDLEDGSTTYISELEATPVVEPDAGTVVSVTHENKDRGRDRGGKDRGDKDRGGKDHGDKDRAGTGSGSNAAPADKTLDPFKKKKRPR